MQLLLLVSAQVSAEAYVAECEFAGRTEKIYNIHTTRSPTANRVSGEYSVSEVSAQVSGPSGGFAGRTEKIYNIFTYIAHTIPTNATK